MFRKIDGKLIEIRRGERSLQEIADRASGAFTKTALFFWEKGTYKPTDDNIMALVKALNCSYDEISVPVDV
jgi:hypothetical protein